MSDWSLRMLLSELHNDIQNRLTAVRSAFAHPGTKGDASERVWLELLQNYLPNRYSAETAHVVDSLGKFSQQIDVVVFDRQYSPFIFNYGGHKIIPAESVYAVFEAKQTINANYIKYAHEKVASVRALYRTSLPIPHAGGTYSAKSLFPILGGLLTLDSDWNPPLGTPLTDALASAIDNQYLDLGCIAQYGMFSRSESNEYSINVQAKPATMFLLELIARLQECATVPMIDVRAYARWLQ
jgi:hypothetical protein